MSLFPAAPRPAHLVQFNAGKCIREGNMLKPDVRKGMIYMDQSDDQLMHFYWKERKSSAPEDDLIIFPDEAELIRVQECTTGRVYLLKFKTSNQKLFFWMQSKDQTKDEDVVSRVNQLINDPHNSMDEERSPLSSTMDLNGDTPSELMRILGNEDQDNILQYLQTAGGYGGTVPVPSNTGGDGPVDQPPFLFPESQPTRSESGQPPQNTENANRPAAAQPEALEQLRSMLANVQQSGSQNPPIQLNDVLTPQAIRPLLNDPEISRSLFPFLPDNVEHSEEEVRQVVQSPQFQQSLQSLSSAIQSGQLGPLLSQLGLDPSAGQSVEAFLRAIEKQARDRERNGGEAMEE
ncbi:proteasome complex subunit Rpn13 ubiquitin receptor-domain-containing protein [Phycomyces nitens]|nr:proteasome complex subunit Rpn13 ubiquitin receptor-domain-containing protein [Phycomyces nitens]